MPLPIVAITNQSTVLTDLEVQAVLAALQKQVSTDFKAYWDLECSIIFWDKASPLPAGWWQIVVLDDPDQAGALGYHEMTAQGTPLGKIFAKLDKESGSSWTVTLSHELLEMLGDPWIDYCVAAEDGKLYALEVCDAVEADACGYMIDGFLLSDFVTPSWFESTEADRLSFQKHVTKPLELAAGGYISIREAGNWTQITARRIAAAQSIPEGSRRHRRTVPGSTWRKSEL